MTFAWAMLTGNALALTIGLAFLFGLLFHLALAHISIQKLDISIVPKADRIRSMEPFPFELQLRNRSRWLPFHCPVIHLEESGRHREQRFAIAKTIPPRDTLTTLLYPRFTRRGRQLIRVVQCDSDFPFRLSVVTRLLNIPSEPVRIWPAAKPVSTEALLAMTRRSQREREFSQHGESMNFDPNHFRGYRPGDPKRQVNWKLSAKAGALMVNTPEEGQQSSLYFALSTHTHFWRRPVDFENAIQLLSSLIEESYALRRLSGILIDHRRIPIRHRFELEDALDTLSELELDATIDSTPSPLERGDFVVSQGRKGIVIRDWRGAIVLE